MYFLLKEDPNTHREVYATRVGERFVGVRTTQETSLQFATAAEGYKFASYFPSLDTWKVGPR